ncbi:hypothetical protein [Nocardia rhamnosiphila]
MRAANPSIGEQELAQQGGELVALGACESGEGVVQGTGRNRQRWHFLVVTDNAQRAAVADVYRRAVHLAPGTPQILHVPYDRVMLAALIPLAFSVGTDFRPAKRIPRDQALHWNQW